MGNKASADPFIEAAESCSVKEVQNLLATLRIPINSIDKDGNTALIKAASRGRLEVIKFLLNKRAKLNIANTSGNTAIMEAIKTSNQYQTSVESVEWLLETGADVMLLNKEGMNCLMLAVQVGNFEIVEKLLNREVFVQSCIQVA